MTTDIPLPNQMYNFLGEIIIVCVDYQKIKRMCLKINMAYGN
jgi:hypothetical protein